MLATYHTHMNPKGQTGPNRLAPSGSDLRNALNAGGREHYVVDPWVVHVIDEHGYRQLGPVSALLPVTAPPIPKGLTSTVEA
ncbi:MAG TPA: hypothetical protein VF520_12785 [Thermoleophilaceae bacterium]